MGRNVVAHLWLAANPPSALTRLQSVVARRCPCVREARPKGTSRHGQNDEAPPRIGNRSWPHPRWGFGVCDRARGARRRRPVVLAGISRNSTSSSDVKAQRSLKRDAAHRVGSELTAWRDDAGIRNRNDVVAMVLAIAPGVAALTGECATAGEIFPTWSFLACPGPSVG